MMIEHFIKSGEIVSDADRSDSVKLENLLKRKGE